MVLWLYDVVRLQCEVFEGKRKAVARGLVLGANAAWEEAGQEGHFLDVDGRTPTVEEAMALGAGILDDMDERDHRMDAHLAALEADRRLILRQMKSVREALARFAVRAGLESAQLLA